MVKRPTSLPSARGGGLPGKPRLQSLLQVAVGPPECAMLGRLTIVITALIVGFVPLALSVQLAPVDSPVRTFLAVTGLIVAIACAIVAFLYSRTERADEALPRGDIFDDEDYLDEAA